MTGEATRRRAVIAALALALLVRAILGAADAVAIARGGVRIVPVPESVALSTPSPLWPAFVAALAVVAAARLPFVGIVGWVLAVATCVASLVGGIADLGLLRPGAPLADAGFWIFFAVYLVVPAAVLTALLAVRDWFVPARAGRRPAWPRPSRAAWRRMGRGPGDT